MSRVAGEELPPVVGVLEGDIAGWLASLDEAWGAYEAFAEKMSGQSVDLGGIAAPDMLATGEAMGAQLSEGIAEGAAGLDLAPEMQEALSGASEAGAAAGDEIAAGITGASADAGAQAGAALTATFDEATAGIGPDLGDRLAAGVDQAAPRIAQSATGAIGQAFAAGMAESLGAGALEAGALTGLSASLSDAAAEAGGAAGVELSRNLSEAAVSALSDEDFAAFTDMLLATASTAAGDAGAAAGETFAAALNTSLIGTDLIGEGLSTVGQSMKAGAQAAAQETADVLAQAEDATLTGTQAYEAELDAVFESIWRGGQGMSVQLAAAMTEAFQGIEADTSGFTQAELAIFTEFYQALNQLGDQAALDLAERLRVVSQGATSGGDLMASGSSTIGLPMPGGGVGAAGGVSAGALSSEQHAAQLAAENAAAMGEMGAAADTAEAAVGGLGAAMGGPLMWGLLGVASLLPMVGSLFNSGSQAAQAYAQQQQQLQQAVSQDSNMIGANTVATIANQLATSGAADTLQGYGVSLSDATAAMAGVKSAQTDVNGTINEQIDNLQSLIQEQSAHSQGVSTDIENERQQVQQLQATRDAMQQLENDVVSAVQHQNELTQATIYAEQAADVFNVQVRAGVLALQQSAQQANVNAAALGAYDMTLVSSSTAYKNAVNDQAIALANSAIQAGINAQALNQSLGPQAQLSSEALTAAVNYQQAGTATGQYTNALTALYGQYGQTSGALATANLAVSNLSGTITSGKDAVNLYTQAGDKNFQQFQSAAQAAETYAEKLYQQTGDTDQATQALQTFAEKIDHAAAEAHLTKGQIDQLNTALFGVPDVKDITIKLDPNSAEAQMSALDSFIQGEIASINNTPISPPVSIGGHPLSVRDTGGPVQQGTPYAIGLNGKPEVFVPGADGYITPMDMLPPAGYAASPALGSPSYAAADGQAPIVNVYIDGRLVTAGVRSTSQQYKVRNALTGLT